MALKIIEFFGFEPLDRRADVFVNQRRCPFVNDECIKPRHGACSVCQINGEPVICCPNRIYAEEYGVIQTIAKDCFGIDSKLIKPSSFKARTENKTLIGNEIIVFGHKWGGELPLPTPPGASRKTSRHFYVDWILAKVTKSGEVEKFTAVEVQTIDTTGNYSDQATSFFNKEKYTDAQGRSQGYSKAGLNWENVNKRILPQVIYKGHVLHLEKKCTFGLYFVCSKQVLERIKDRLGDQLRDYPQGRGTITFRSYTVSRTLGANGMRSLVVEDQFTTTVDQVALAFTSPGNLPQAGVYEDAIERAMH